MKIDNLCAYNDRTNNELYDKSVISAHAALSICQSVWKRNTYIPFNYQHALNIGPGSHFLGVCVRPVWRGGALPHSHCAGLAHPEFVNRLHAKGVGAPGRQLYIGALRTCGELFEIVVPLGGVVRCVELQDVPSDHSAVFGTKVPPQLSRIAGAADNFDVFRRRWRPCKTLESSRWCRLMLYWLFQTLRFYRLSQH